MEVETMKPSKILYCTDFSDNSEPARKSALEYADSFGADLALLHVAESSVEPHGERSPDPETVALVGMEETSKAELDTLAEKSGHKPGVIKTYSRTGAPAQEIVRLASEESVDLIVVGTHGWTGIRHVVRGSVADKVARNATCPVLIVRGPAEPAPMYEYPVP
jgi:nucleotide-binding universal stress UspA family protein